MGCHSSKGMGAMAEDPASATREFREALVLEQSAVDVFAKYTIVKQLEEGSIGSVSLVRKIRSQNRDSSSDSDDHYFAMKTIITNRVNKQMLEEMQNEINILRTLDHPNIIQLLEVYKVKRNIFIIMEYCRGGNLGHRTFPEPRAAQIMRQILRALSYLHDRSICHRDLKLENIMFLSDEEDSIVKLIDFGLSRTYTRGEKMRVACGTVYSMAPEILSSVGYTQQADMWSVGIIAFALLSGTVPFLNSEGDLADDRKRQRLIEARFDFHGPVWQSVTRQSREFIASLLRRRPESRWSAKEALRFVEEQWLPALEQQDSQVLPDGRSRVSTDVFESMQRFASYGKFKKAALMIMAFTMDKRKLMQLSELFCALDTEKNGVISFDELKTGLEKFGIPEDKLRELFSAVDQDHSGRLHYMEFLAATLEAKGFLEEERLAEAFERLDKDHTGYISKSNLKAMLGTTFDNDTIDRMMQEVHSSRDGMINYEEFRTLMQPKLEAQFDPNLILRQSEDKPPPRAVAAASEDRV